jgi:hypothetical protein
MVKVLRRRSVTPFRGANRVFDVPHRGQLRVRIAKAMVPHEVPLEVEADNVKLWNFSQSCGKTTSPPCRGTGKRHNSVVLLMGAERGTITGSIGNDPIDPALTRHNVELPLDIFSKAAILPCLL